MGQQSVPPIYRFGRFELQPCERRLLAGGEPLALGPRAFDVLVVLTERAGQLVTKDELLARVWPRLVVEENNLQAQVSALRRILGQATIETIPGHGYRLTAKVESAVPTPSPAPLPQSNNNLPHPLTTFVGREKDLAEQAHILRNSRLLTLTGIGGCGKTRLAIKLAEAVIPSFPDGVWFVDLAPVAEPERVALTVATTLGVREQPGEPFAQTLIRHFASQRSLLVLDNCEHLLAACASLAERLLLAASSVQVLVTSREGLGVPGECIVPVRSLAFPSQGEQDVQALTRFEAVRLFVDRARQVEAGFTLDAVNAPVVGEICRRLDGIPLALELAAARVKLLSVDQIRARLDDRFRLLTGSARGMSRHQTLLGVLQWSYEHLMADEQRWLQRLSVFAGGWTLESATAVAGQGCEEPETLQRMERLIDMSFVAVDLVAPAGPRYGMLETVRQYAQERLNESGESDAVRERHLAYFLALAKQAHPNFFTRSANHWYRCLDGELSNILAAHAWCTGATEGVDLGLELAIHLRLYWINRGLFALGEQVYDEALARDGADRRSILRAGALHALGQHRNFCGRIADAIAPLEESLSIARECGDDECTGNCLDKLGFAHAFVGDSTGARAYVEEELEVCRRTGQEMSPPLMTKGTICRMFGDYATAAEALEEALLLCNKGNVDYMHTILTEIARVAIARGALEHAQEMLAQSIRLLSDLDSRYRSALALDVTSLLAAARGDCQRAARLQCVCEMTLNKMDDFRNPYDDAVLADLRRKPRAVLDPEGFAAAYEMGRGYSLEQALAESLAWMQQGWNAEKTGLGATSMNS